MLGITVKAKEKLKDILQEHTMDPEVAIRIIPNSSDPKRLDSGQREKGRSISDKR